MNYNSYIWKSWSEISDISADKEVILYGRSEDWLPKTIRKIKNIKYIIDQNIKYQNTKYQNIDVFLPEKLFKELSTQNKFIIITSSIYYQIVEVLIEHNLKPGRDFCCCPEFKDYSALENIKKINKNVLVSSSDYLEKSRARSSKNGGGIYEYNLLECDYELKIPGVYRQVTKVGDNFFAVEYVEGEIHIFDKQYSIIDRVGLDSANYCGISFCEKNNILTVINAASDAILILDGRNFSVLDKIFFSKSPSIEGSSNYHLNDCCIYDEKLFITMFSHTGRWKNGIFDGSLVEYDLGKMNETPKVLVNNAWMPHSPEFIDGEICYLDSMRGDLRTSNQYPTAHFDYFARGLDGDGRYYLIGASENMYSSRITDSGGKQSIMVNAGFSVFDRQTNLKRFHPFMQNMNIHDVKFLN